MKWNLMDELAPQVPPKIKLMHIGDWSCSSSGHGLLFVSLQFRIRFSLIWTECRAVYISNISCIHAIWLTRWINMPKFYWVDSLTPPFMFLHKLKTSTSQTSLHYLNDVPYSCFYLKVFMFHLALGTIIWVKKDAILIWNKYRAALEAQVEEIIIHNTLQHCSFHIA